ncbi:MAG: hypothetical protein K9M54_12270 [Kiritimatiellales bacterium]|nr:hypothetical protein [Kiritimatiellales bacterium]
MKIEALFIALSLTVCSFASEIPEAREFHPDLYTVQFTLAEFPNDFEMETKSERQAFLNYSSLSTAERAALKSDIIKRIQSSEAKYTNLATIHSESGKPFSGENGVVKGILDSESNTLDILNLEIPNYGTLDPLKIDMKSNDWFTMFLVGKIVDGKEKKCCILIKCYPPKK